MVPAQLKEGEFLSNKTLFATLKNLSLRDHICRPFLCSTIYLPSSNGAIVLFLFSILCLHGAFVTEDSTQVGEGNLKCRGLGVYIRGGMRSRKGRHYIEWLLQKETVLSKPMCSFTFQLKTYKNFFLLHK